MNNELYLNKEIYDEKYIQIAIQAYQGLAEISYKLNACWWMCSFTATPVSYTHLTLPTTERV